MMSRSQRSGRLRQNLSGDQAYFSFLPSSLPPDPPIQLDAEIMALLRQVHDGIGCLKGMAMVIPDINLFLAMYVRKEALFSSQIEGTQATIDDIFDPTINQNSNRDVVDVLDNVNAIFFALEQLKAPDGLPLCMRLLRRTHEKLLEHCRGKDKNPGQFRSSQNWIGPTGCSLNTASYVPPNLEDMNRALIDLEAFLHTEDELDPFIKAALIHYQFETIHPFLDGNGRIGRLLILLYLIHAGVLSEPLLYISYFLKLHRGEYYEHMMAVRRDGCYEVWIKFFLMAAHEAIIDTIDSIKKLCDLHDGNRTRILQKASRTSTRRQWEKFLTHLEHHPIIETKTTAQKLGISFPTASRLIARFVELGILHEVTGKQRSRVFSYEDYLSILRKGAGPLP